MLHSANTLKGYSLHGRDGVIGKAEEFYFDDHRWAIRYLVVDTGGWLTGRQVLISPYAVVTVNRAERFIALDLTREQIENSPSLETDAPVSRQFEEAYYGYYTWPTYWCGPNLWGPSPDLVSARNRKDGAGNGEKPWDSHLRSTRDATGHHLQALDGEVGHIEDFLVDDEAWGLRYFIVDTENWWPGRKLLISPRWIERVSWSEKKVFCSLLRSAVKLSPEYVAGSLPTRDYETGLHHHYDRPGYWSAEPVSPGQPR